MRKLISILLLGCLLLNIAGLQVFFYVRLHEIKKEMTAFLRIHPNQSGTVQFDYALNDRVALSKLEWDGDDEFELNGNMYDVIDKKIKDGRLTIHCLADDEETSLIKAYLKITHANSSTKKHGGCVQFSNSNVLAKNPEVEIPTFTDRIYCVKIFFFTPSHSPDILTPPPQARLS